MKKIIVLLSLLFILASCGTTKQNEENTASGNVNVEIDDQITTGTAAINESGEVIVDFETTTSGSLDEQQVSDDIDALLNEIINTAENE